MGLQQMVRKKGKYMTIRHKFTGKGGFSGKADRKEDVGIPHSAMVTRNFGIFLAVNSAFVEGIPLL